MTSMLEKINALILRKDSCVLATTDGETPIFLIIRNSMRNGSSRHLGMLLNDKCPFSAKPSFSTMNWKRPCTC